MSVLDRAALEAEPARRSPRDRLRAVDRRIPPPAQGRADRRDPHPPGRTTPRPRRARATKPREAAPRPTDEREAEAPACRRRRAGEAEAEREDERATSEPAAPAARAPRRPRPARAARSDGRRRGDERRRRRRRPRAPASAPRASERRSAEPEERERRATARRGRRGRRRAARRTARGSSASARPSPPTTTSTSPPRRSSAASSCPATGSRAQARAAALRAVRLADPDRHDQRPAGLRARRRRPLRRPAGRVPDRAVQARLRRPDAQGDRVADAVRPGSRVTIVGRRPGRARPRRCAGSPRRWPAHEELQLLVALAGVRPEEISEWNASSTAPAGRASASPPRPTRRTTRSSW